MIACLLFFGFFTKAQGQTTPEFIANELDTYIENSLANWQIPGAAVCIVKDGEIVVNKGYGVRQSDQAAPVDINTLFLLGSTSKAMVSTALASLAYQGKCDLQDPIKKWLPEFALSDPWVWEEVTLQDFLSHRSGLGHFQGDFLFYDSDLTKAEFYQVIKQLTLENDFRSFGYSNIGYFLIGEAIEAISGNTLADQLQSSVFGPIQMDRSQLQPSEFTKETNRSSPHTLENEKVVLRPIGNMEHMAAAGGISTSIDDLSQWLTAQLDSGRINGNTVIPYEVLQTVRKPQILVGASGPPYTIFNSSNFEQYSSGWYNLDYQGTEVVTHNGGTYGFASSITLVPEHQLGIAILTNSDEHLLFDALKLEILDAYLGLPTRNYSQLAQRMFQYQKMQQQEALGNLKQQISSAPQSKIPLTRYAGNYENDIYGEITLSVKGETLEMRFQHHPELWATLEFMEEGKFLGTFNNSIYGTVVFPFTIEEGRVKQLDFSVDANVEPHHYVFEKLN